MGLLTDLLNSFMVLFGGQDAVRDFRSHLDSGKRFLRWGQDSGKIKDFETAVRELRSCVDDYAPGGYELINKYKFLGEALLGMMHIEKNSLDSKLKNAEKKYESDESFEKKIQAVEEKIHQTEHLTALAREGKTAELKKILNIPASRLNPEEIVLDKKKESEQLEDDLQKIKQKMTVKSRELNMIMDQARKKLVDKKLDVEDLVKKLDSTSEKITDKDIEFRDTTRKEIEDELSTVIRELKKCGVDLSSIRESASLDQTDDQTDEDEQEQKQNEE